EFQAEDHAANVSDPAFAAFVLDSVPPAITPTPPPPAVNLSPVISGSVSDKLSGVAALQAQVDGGAPGTIPVDAKGNFSFPVDLRVTGTEDGPPTVEFQATDHAGNIATGDVGFTLDTQPPTVTIASPIHGETLAPGALLVGTVTAYGVAPAAVDYSFDGG